VIHLEAVALANSKTPVYALRLLHDEPV